MRHQNDNIFSMKESELGARMQPFTVYRIFPHTFYCFFTEPPRGYSGEVLIDISILQMQKLRLTLRKRSDKDVFPYQCSVYCRLTRGKGKLNWGAIPSPWNCQRPRGSLWTSSISHSQHSLPWSTEHPPVAIQATQKSHG